MENRAEQATESISNAQSYSLNSFLLSRIIPAEALDDDWAKQLLQAPVEAVFFS